MAKWLKEGKDTKGFAIKGKGKEKHEKKRGKERKHNKGEQHTPSEPFDSKEETTLGVGLNTDLT